MKKTKVSNKYISKLSPAMQAVYKNYELNRKAIYKKAKLESEEKKKERY